MEGNGVRTRRAWRIGSRKPADYLIIARLNDPGLASLIASFPAMTGTVSGEAREPHVTLFGPLWLRGRGGVILQSIEDASSLESHLSCRVSDLIRLEGVRGGAIAFSVTPGADLTRYYRALVALVPPLATRITWIDRPPGQRIFHISLRFNIPFRVFDALWELVGTLVPSPHYNPDGPAGDCSPLFTYLPGGNSPISLFRIAVMRRGSLWKEYDVPRRLWLTRAAAYDPRTWEKTYATYRAREGMELEQANASIPGRRFVIADLHLGHRNIIQYCRRPFSSAAEMDRVLIRNWNYTVSPENEVFYLGDLRHGVHALPAARYLARLNGRIQVVSGNHDSDIPHAVSSMRVSHRESEFFLIHDPALAPPGLPGWLIHGHLHNNDCTRYPFINAETRTINVSAELVNYVPLSLDELLTILEKILPGERITTLNEARSRGC